MFLYKTENNINSKMYIGITNNFSKRKEVNEKEQEYITLYESYNREKGYNLTLGGGGNKRELISYEEKLNLSKLFSKEEIKDIQNDLRMGKSKDEIIQKYNGKLKRTFLDNINYGYNFKNEEWAYPLHNYKELKKGTSINFTLEEQEQIKEEIKSNRPYKEISEQWGLSVGLISMINNGKTWKNERDVYPLCTKGCSRIHNLKTWVIPVQQDLLHSTLSIKEIAEKYGKAYSTIKKINSGSSHRNKDYKYPLR